MGTEPTPRLRRAAIIVLTASAVTVTAALVIAVAAPSSLAKASLAKASPAEVAERFLRARYARQAERLYQLASAADRAERTLAEFIAVNPPYPASVRPAVDALAESIRFSAADTEAAGDQARVTIRAALPNSADRDLGSLLQAAQADRAFGGPESPERAESERAESERAESPERAARDIRADARAGRLPMVEVTETVDLIREGGRWRVIMGWDADLPVTLRAEVAGGVPLEFTILTAPELRLRPGETGRATFAIRNASDASLRVMAAHAYAPPAAQRHVELIRCFCFFEERLDAGESRQLSLVFRLGWDLPSAIDAVAITYRYDRSDADSQDRPS